MPVNVPCGTPTCATSLQYLHGHDSLHPRDIIGSRNVKYGTPAGARIHARTQRTALNTIHHSTDTESEISP
jgi:hypothetical protein